MHLSTSTKQALPFLFLTTTSLLTPPTSAQTPDSGSLQACTDCLTTAAITLSPSCATTPHFSALNLTSASNATQEEKTCICGLTKDENQFWVRGCIAKPPAACTGQGNATTVMYDVLASYKSVCPVANATTTGPSPGGVTNTGKNNSGGTVVPVSLSSLFAVAVVSFVAGAMSLAI